MRIKRGYHMISIILLMILYTTLLTGCRLAITTFDIKEAKDQISGVFVTIGYHETIYSDHDAVDTKVKVNNKGELYLDDLTSGSEQESRVEGIVSDDGRNVSFDIDGYFIGVDEIVNEYGPCRSLIGGDGLSDLKFNVGIYDTEEVLSCEATLYVSSEFNNVLYVNPVYKTSDGTYYTLLNNVNGCSFSGSESGGSFSQKLDFETTETIGDKTRKEKRSFLIYVTVVDVIENIFIKEMNQEDELVKTTEYLQEDEEEFIVDPDTRYVIVEESLNNISKGTYIKRCAYTPLPKDSEEATNSHRCNFSGSEGRIDQQLVKFIYD